MYTSPQSMKRVDWIDYAKGIGIFLVVFGHVIRGLFSSYGEENLMGLQPIDTWIYTFHMPLFFFVSGLFSITSEHKTIKEFILEKSRTILYPYVIWCGIIGVLRVFIGRKGDNLGVFLSDFWRVIYQPIDICWFLYVLFLISTSYFLFRKLQISPLRILLITIGLYFIYLITPQIFIWDPLKRLVIYSTYFTFGAIASNWTLNQPVRSNGLLLTGSISGFVTIVLATYFKFLILPDPNLILGFVGITSCLLLAKFLGQLDRAHFIKKWGCLSLQIYLGHTASASFTRIILQKVFHLDTIIIHLILETIVGIYLPIMLTRTVNKLNFPYLFMIPKQLPKSGC
jgi:fucose 4-O-acetylase-like acetyltransferase